MARPLTDLEAGRQQLLDHVETLVRKRGAADISMTDLATEAGMSPSNIYRFFDNKEAVLEAVAEKWFAEKILIMEEVASSDLPIREKMFAYFARRFLWTVDQYEADPSLYKSYMEIGQIYFDVVRGYVDLGDHYLAEIVAQAMDNGYFRDLTIDEAVSLINQMVQCYVNPEAVMFIGTSKLNVDKLQRIVDTIFRGLGAADTNTADNVTRIGVLT
jgi:AcrR family transcriptional regulator